MNEEKEFLINFLRKSGYLNNPIIISAFEAIDRADFLPAEYKEKAYENIALPIGNGEVASQPVLVAFMLELLNPIAGEKILEIGTGSGWQTAIIANIVNNKNEEKKGEVPNILVTIEKSSGIVTYAEKNLQKYGFIESGLVRVVHGNGLKAYKKESPYDKIISGVAVKSIPEQWKSQLKIGGKIVAPIKGSVVVIDKIGKDEFQKKEYFGFNFPEAKE